MKYIKEKFNIKREKNTFNLFEVIIIALAFSCLTGVVVGYTVYLKNNKNLILDNEALDIVDTYNNIVNNFYGALDKEEIKSSAIDGMMKTLNEKYSVYLDSDQSSSLEKSLNGNYQGIGIQIMKNSENVSIVSVFDDSPASAAGLKEGDIIKQIDDYVINIDDELQVAVDKIKNKKKVVLKIIRDEKELEFTIKVKNIDTPVIKYQTFEKNDKKIGYIYLSNFSNTAYKQFKSSLDNLEKNNINSLIIDLRNNTGGYLDAANKIASLFIKKGKVLYALEDNNGKVKVYDKTNDYRNYDVVVLVNSLSASSSEILASSLKESYGATLIGSKTFGKGTVQQTSNLSKNSMIKYTIAAWYTPLGNSINEIGLTPGIEVSLTKEYAENPSDETDSQLQKALEFLGN